MAEVEDRLLGFQEHYEQASKPFEWKFTRDELNQLLAKLPTDQAPHREAA